MIRAMAAWQQQPNPRPPWPLTMVVCPISTRVPCGMGSFQLGCTYAMACFSVHGCNLITSYPRMCNPTHGLVVRLGLVIPVSTSSGLARLEVGPWPVAIPDFLGLPPGRGNRVCILGARPTWEVYYPRPMRQTTVALACVCMHVCCAPQGLVVGFTTVPPLPEMIQQSPIPLAMAATLWHWDERKGFTLFNSNLAA